MARAVKVVPMSDIRTDNEIRRGMAMHGYGGVVRAYKTVKPTKAMCGGCRDNFYNSAYGMNGECWSFREAVVVDKVGYAHINVTGGPDTKMVKTLDCWHATRK